MGSFSLVDDDGVPSLIPILEQRLPNSAMLYNVVQFFIERSFSENVKTKFLVYSEIGEEEKESLIVAIQDRTFYRSKSVVVSGPPCPTKGSIESFEKLIDWEKPHLFAALDVTFSIHVKEILTRHPRPCVVDPNYFYWLPLHIAKDLDDKPTKEMDGVEVRPLVRTDAEKVTNSWKFATSGTLRQMEDTIMSHGSTGLYVNGELISWVVTAAAGSINALHTDSNYRRRGFGELTMKAMAKAVALRGLIPNVQVQHPNLASKSLMEKIGFLFSHNVEWIDFD